MGYRNFLSAVLVVALLPACGGGGGSGTDAPAFELSGQVTEQDAGRANISIQLTGDADKTTTTDVDGTYAFPRLSPGTYTVTASVYGQLLTPSQREVIIVDADVASVDFILDIGSMCGACHGVPPLTGNHVKHFGATVAEATYGGTGATSEILPDGSSYVFDCGNCHPTDIASHMNGVRNGGVGQAEIVFDGSDAPAGTLKALNAPGASYTPGETLETDEDGMAFTNGTCDGVYCHSEMEYSAQGPIPRPGYDFPFLGYPIEYPEYDVVSQRVYLTPQWGGAALACGDCHGFPPRTSAPEVEAGVGDSHSWIDSYGYENIHGWNHGAPPVACATCHYNTVTEQGVRSRDASDFSVYAPVPIAHYSSHVNGTADIAFTTDTITYSFSTPKQMLLSDAGYDSATKKCTNVACHIHDTAVKWGTPFRWNIPYECATCHQY